MRDFERLAHLFAEAVRTGAWVNLAIYFGGAFILGIIAGKVAFAISRFVGYAATAYALWYLADLAISDGGIIYSFVFPQAWIAWGTVFVAGKKGIEKSIY